MTLERTDCARCSGTGQVTKMVAGRSGLVSCPDCDNVPQHAVPTDPPDDPEARLTEIDARLSELRDEQEAWNDVQSDIREAQELLDEVADHDLVPDETGVKLAHIQQQIGIVMHDSEKRQAISYEKQQLGRKKAELETYIEALNEREGSDDAA